MEYGSNEYLIVKSLHIIFVVSYFAGLFYILRLFVYYKEADQESGEKKEILQHQFRQMVQKLWNIIIAPASVIMLITGIIMLTANDYYLLKQPWMHIKLALLLFLLFLHLFTWKITQKISQSKTTKFSSIQLRYINEIPTLILFAVVFVVILKQNILTLYPKLIIGFTIVVLIIFGIVKLVNKKNK